MSLWLAGTVTARSRPAALPSYKALPPPRLTPNLRRAVGWGAAAMVLHPVLGKLVSKRVVLASASPRRQEILTNVVSARLASPRPASPGPGGKAGDAAARPPVPGAEGVQVLSAGLGLRGPSPVGPPVHRRRAGTSPRCASCGSRVWYASGRCQRPFPRPSRLPAWAETERPGVGLQTAGAVPERTLAYIGMLLFFSIPVFLGQVSSVSKYLVRQFHLSSRLI